jgi:hypothetical protein
MLDNIIMEGDIIQGIRDTEEFKNLREKIKVKEEGNVRRVKKFFGYDYYIFDFGRKEIVVEMCTKSTERGLKRIHSINGFDWKNDISYSLSHNHDDFSFPEDGFKKSDLEVFFEYVPLVGKIGKYDITLITPLLFLGLIYSIPVGIAVFIISLFLLFVKNKNESLIQWLNPTKI